MHGRRVGGIKIYGFVLHYRESEELDAPPDLQLIRWGQLGKFLLTLGTPAPLIRSYLGELLRSKEVK